MSRRTHIAAILFLFAWQDATASQNAGPQVTRISQATLERPEFDQPLSMDIRGASPVRAFSMLSATLGMPFVLDFEQRETLRLSIVTEATPARDVLAGFSSGYGLMFELDAQGLRVTRPGFGRLPAPLVVGEWRVSQTFAYQVDLMIRSEAHAFVVQPSLVVLTGKIARFRRGVNGQPILQLDDNASRAVQRDAGAVAVSLLANRENEGTLEIALELNVEEALVPDSISQLRTTVVATLSGNGPWKLIERDGIEVSILRWKRSP